MACSSLLLQSAPEVVFCIPVPHLDLDDIGPVADFREMVLLSSLGARLAGNRQLKLIPDLPSRCLKALQSV